MPLAIMSHNTFLHTWLLCPNLKALVLFLSEAAAKKPVNSIDKPHKFALIKSQIALAKAIQHGKKQLEMDFFSLKIFFIFM